MNTPAEFAVPAVGTVLILEDNAIIALDMEDILQEMGAAHVVVCRTCREALDALVVHDVQFALLDVHLGDETSLGVAQALRSEQIPFLLVSGSGKERAPRFDMGDVPELSKPFTSRQLQMAVMLSWSKLAHDGRHQTQRGDSSAARFESYPETA